MVRTPFIPARDSRHRAAVLALYRALAKSAAKVTLPERTGDFSRDSQPLRVILRQRFERNSIDISPRLVFAAMTAGYKFLNLLDKARDPESSEYGEIVRHLSAMKEPPTRRPNPPPKTKDRAAKKEPLLVRTSKPGEPPKYGSNIFPRPDTPEGRRRRVPIMAMTSEGQPFLRTSSRQPDGMSKMIKRRNYLYKSNILKIVDIQDVAVQESKWEDEWDQIVARQTKQEGYNRDEAMRDIEESYVWSVHLSRLWHEWKIEQIWSDWIARGEAFQNIVDEERKLADKEAGKTAKPDNTTPRAQQESGANVKPLKFPVLTPSGGEAKLARVEAADTFASEAWADVVEHRRPALRSWASEALYG